MSVLHDATGRTGPPTRLRASAVVLAQGHLLLVRLRDPVTREENLYPPGGAIERDELPADAARRETLEETGLHIRCHDPVITLVDTYPFRWAGIDRTITTHYFAALLAQPFDLVIPTVVDAEYNLGASWMPVADALAAMAPHPVIATATAQVLAALERATLQR